MLGGVGGLCSSCLCRWVLACDRYSKSALNIHQVSLHGDWLHRGLGDPKMSSGVAQG